VEQLRRLHKGRFAQELPLATELVRELHDPALLFLGCMLHDIGKGHGGGHSARGAELIPEIGRRLGLDHDDIEDVRFIVFQHLTMSSMAERRDVHDARTILNLANIVGSRARLRNLYLATLADIRSVSKEAWTSWKAGLLEALYRNTAEWLETGVSDASASGFFLQRTMERVARVEAEATAQLAASGIPSERVAGFLASMPRRYLLAHGSSEIAEHVPAALAHAESDRVASVSTFRPQSRERSFLGLVVTAADRPGLLALMTGVLRSSARDILGAQIYTTRDGLAVQIYEVAPLEGGPEEDEAERERLERRLIAVLEGRQQIDELIAARPEPPSAARAQPPDIRMTNEDSDFYTIIDVAATDRPGLLHDITGALSDAGIDVFMSRVSTRARRVNDSFSVTEHGNKILDLERQSELEAVLLRAIEGAPA
jgi:[protein-PII] uridylyltransferase